LLAVGVCEPAPAARNGSGRARDPDRRRGHIMPRRRSSSRHGRAAS
jgi:hypothetical protein